MHRMIALALCVATEALAHPQHAEGAWAASLAHLLSEPDHLALLLVPLVVAGAIIVRLRRRARPSRNRAPRGRGSSRP